MSLISGTKIGPYEVVSLLGAGGMGEVYRATDINLGRQVALKVLSPAFANDAERMARFRREAQVLASLNHPNIASIYGIEGNAIVMELVEGKDLAGPLPLGEALPIARQIAEALEAAHEKQIVHRDLKPANIKITPQGVVKLLDFGLAKAAEPEPSDISNSPTMSLAMTSAGMILGTAAYMPPEQARGQQVDRRADIWAFGLVFLEMLTGKKSYSGETVADTLAAVLKDSPSLDALPASTPAAIRNLIQRCLEKDPRRRLQWIGEARVAMEVFLANPEGGAESPVQAKALPHIVPWVVAAAAIIVAVVGWYLHLRPEPLRPLIRVTDELGPESIPVRTGGAAYMAISPDGTRVAVILSGADKKSHVYTRLLSQSNLIQLAATDGAQNPLFSPDGHNIAFFADGKLKKISVDGGTAVAICDAPNGRGASWGDDGNIVLALGNQAALSRVPATGGMPTPLNRLLEGERSNRWPQVLPGSKAVIFSANRGPNFTIEGLNLKTGARRTILKDGIHARYVPTSGRSGHLVYFYKNTLFAAPFDPESLTLTGAAVPIVEEVLSLGHFAVSSTGSFIYLKGKENRVECVLTIIDKAGNSRPILSAPGVFATPRLSPDGKQLAYSLEGASSTDIWVKDLDRATPSRLTFLPGVNMFPTWTPDGRFILFESRTPAGAFEFYSIRSDGSGEPQLLSSSPLKQSIGSISPDGKRLAFSLFVKDHADDIFTAPVEGEPTRPKLGKPELFVGTPYRDWAPAFSPDGRWLAYSSEESGRSEIYVRPFPGSGGRWLISNNGGRVPIWSKDGRELLYHASDNHVMSVSYAAKGDSFIASKPRIWSEVRLAAPLGFEEFDITPDGQHIIAMLTEKEEQERPANHLTVLFNFNDELRRKAP